MKVSFMFAVKYIQGIFDKNNFIHFKEFHYWWLGEEFTHVQ